MYFGILGKGKTAVRGFADLPWMLMQGTVGKWLKTKAQPN
jgi:hypothetical protein